MYECQRWGGATGGFFLCVVVHLGQMHKTCRLSEELFSFQAESARAHLDDGKTRCVPWQPSPRLARRTPLSQPPPASPRPTTLSARQRLGSLGMNEIRTPKAVGKPQSKQTSITGMGHVCLIKPVMLNLFCGNSSEMLKVILYCLEEAKVHL